MRIATVVYSEEERMELRMEQEVKRRDWKGRGQLVRVRDLEMRDEVRRSELQCLRSCDQTVRTSVTGNYNH